MYGVLFKIETFLSMGKVGYPNFSVGYKEHLLRSASSA